MCTCKVETGQYLQMVLASVINDTRVDKHLSQGTVGKQGDLERSHFASIESGRKCPRLLTLWKVSVGLDTPLSELFRKTEEIMNTFPDNDPEKAEEAFNAWMHQRQLQKEKEVDFDEDEDED